MRQRPYLPLLILLGYFVRALSRLLYSVVLSVAAVLPAIAQQPAAYERRELSIPMRDGTALFAVALVPAKITKPLPILLIRTPYSAAGAFRTATVPPAYRELAEAAVPMTVPVSGSDGTNLHVITPDTLRVECQQAWSPGTRIAFLAAVLRTVDPDGSNLGYVRLNNFLRRPNAPQPATSVSRANDHLSPLDSVRRSGLRLPPARRPTGLRG